MERCGWSSRRFSVLLAFMVFAGQSLFPVYAEVLGPGWFNVTTDPISPEQAQVYYQAGAAADPSSAITPQALNADVTATAAAVATTASPEIIELARALQNDPRLIYEYVHNHIEYVPYFGYLKGPTLTLLERSGNDFDQASLMIELLRAGGYTAQYVYGQMTIPNFGAADNQDMQNWLGIDANATVISKVLGSGGIPGLISASTTTMIRVWVQATIGGTNYIFDPAFKILEQSIGIDLAAAMGYNRAALLATAGGVAGTDYIQNLDDAALRSTLAGYTSSLVSYLRNNYPNAEIEEIIGDGEIIPEYLSSLPTSLKFSSQIGAYWDSIPDAFVHKLRIQLGSIDQSLPIPDVGGKKLSIINSEDLLPLAGDTYDFGMIAQGQAVEVTLPTYQNTWGFEEDIWGVGIDEYWSGANDSGFSVTSISTYTLPPGETLNVTIRFDGTGQSLGTKIGTLNIAAYCCVGPPPIVYSLALTGIVGQETETQLWQDDELIATGLDPATGKSPTEMTLTVDHPYAANNGTFADQTSTYSLKQGATYTIISDFGGSKDSLLLEKRQRILDDYRAQGLADGSMAVLTETLNVMGQTYMQQTTLLDNLLTQLNDVIQIRHHRFGVMAQETGYYVDVPTQFTSTVSRRNNTTDRNAAFKAGSYLASALEHGVLEQLQGVGRPAASTVKLMHIANSQGDRIFQVTSANIAAITPQLTNYSPETLGVFQGWLDQGFTLILPADGNIALQEWSGTGFVVYREDAQGDMTFGMIIGGGYFGGFGGIQAPVDIGWVNTEFVPEIIPPVEIDPPRSKDPVDMLNGAFLYDRTDLVLGGAEPNGLQFRRFYNSRNGTQKTHLGYGWTHNYNIYAEIHSDVGAGLGLRQPVDAAAQLVAAVVTLDLMRSSGPDVKEWTTTVLVNQWAMDELFENAVTIRIGDKALTYIRLPDGSYNGPPGVTTKLQESGGLYSLNERFGTVMDFDAGNRISTWQDVDGNALTFSYNGYVYGSTYRLGAITDNYSRTLTLNDSGYPDYQLTSVTDSTGRSVSFGYGSNSDLTSYTDPEGKVWSFGYDGNHRIKTLTDPLGITTATNTYDSLGRVDTQTVPRQGGTTATYKLYFTGFQGIEEDPAGGLKKYFYDNKGRTIAVEDELNNRTETVFDGQNHALRTTDPRGNATTAVYDGNQNLTNVFNALNQESVNAYDTQFRLTSATNPLGYATQYEYDTEHHLTLTRDAELNESGSTYLPNGRTATSTDGRSTVTSYTYDPLGNPDTVKVGAHPVVDYTYDAIGRMTALTDQVSATTGFVYDDRGLVTSTTDPLTRTATSSYDDAGRLTATTDRNGDTVTTSYTPSSKLDSLTYPDATSVQYAYDSHDRLTSMSDPLGTTSNIYDAAGRLISSTDPNGFTVGYGHDAAGNLTSITYPGNKTVSYSYDALNRLTTVSDWLGGVTRYYYDAAGRLRLQVNANGTYTNYNYDDADRLISVVNRKSGNTVISSHSFTLDGNGNRTQETSEEPIPPSNLPTDNNTFTYNVKKNRLLSTASDTFSYDDEGQQSDKSGTGYSFDYAHRLTGIGANTQYYYDGAGNRLKATRNGQTTKYLYDAQGNLLAEADATNAITRYYIHGAGLLAMVEGANRYTYHYNAVGSTLAMTDSSQNLVNTYSYTLYGRIVNQQETISQPFKYVGQYGVMTEADNLYYMRARYYDPTTGRFISEDPAGLDAGVNLYAYVGGNPISRVDPSGLTGLTSALILRSLQGNEQAADTLGEFSRLSGAAAVFSSFAGPAGQPGVVGFGVAAFGSSVLEQMIRPDLGGAAGGAVLDVALDQLPSRVGGPAGIAINEIRRNQNGRSASNFITPSNMGRNPNISFGSCPPKCF